MTDDPTAAQAQADTDDARVDDIAAAMMRGHLLRVNPRYLTQRWHDDMPRRRRRFNRRPILPTWDETPDAEKEHWRARTRAMLDGFDGWVGAAYQAVHDQEDQ